MSANVSKSQASSANKKSATYDDVVAAAVVLFLFVFIVILICTISNAISKRKSKEREQTNEIIKKYSLNTWSILDENGKMKSVEQLQKERQQREEREKVRQLTEQLQRNKEQQEKKTPKRIHCGYFLVNDTESENVSSSESDHKNEKEEKQITEHDEQKAIYIIRSSKDRWE